MSKFTFGIILALFLSANQLSAQPVPQPSASGYLRYVVNVDVRTASIFGSGGNEGNGTGWVYRIFSENGRRFAYIFTNEHVVAAGAWIAQRVTIEVKDGVYPQPDRARAEVVYSSPYIDFAVLKVELADLKRSADFLVEAPLPPRDNPLFSFEQNVELFVGRESVAIGNPLGGRGTRTFGEISGARSEINYGFLIQTQAPINPGNSGGPLVDKETGFVIGMNSLKLPSADNVGMAIPVSDVIADFERWERNPRAAYRKEFPAAISVESAAAMRFSGVDAIISARHPDYFRHADAALLVEDALPMANGFLAGDIIISVNGQFIGNHFYRIHPILADSERVTFEVVRNGQVITLEQNYPNQAMSQLRLRANFVILSGIIFQEVSERQAFFSFRENPHRVIVAGLIPNREMQILQLAPPPPGSVLVGVNLNNTYYPIDNLDELRALLRLNPAATYVRLDVRRALAGQAGLLRSPLTGAALHEGTTMTYNVPVTEVITPGNIGLSAFTRRFEFEGTDPAAMRSRNWRENLRALPPVDECDGLISGRLQRLLPRAR